MVLLESGKALLISMNMTTPRCWEQNENKWVVKVSKYNMTNHSISSSSYVYNSRREMKKVTLFCIWEFLILHSKIYCHFQILSSSFFSLSLIFAYINGTHTYVLILFCARSSATHHYYRSTIRKIYERWTNETRII